MAEPKTQKTTASVDAFIASVESDTRREDARVVDQLMREITGEEPAMWGPTIVGYGQHQGSTGAWPRAAFSPRKTNLVVYLDPENKDQALLNRLGKHRTGKSCLYINKLADVDQTVLRALIQDSLPDAPNR
jgi:hypothetical protein